MSGERRYDVSLIVGPCSQEQAETLADAILDLQEASAVYAGAVGVSPYYGDRVTVSGFAALERHAADLEAALRKYGRHRSDCITHDGRLACSCGLAAALAVSGATLPEGEPNGLDTKTGQGGTPTPDTPNVSGNVPDGVGAMSVPPSEGAAEERDA